MNTQNNKYLKVLNNNADFMSEESVNNFLNAINAKCNNSKDKKELFRALRKTENIMKHVQKEVDRKAYREYQDAVDENYVHFFACLGLVMYEQYHWIETEDNEHGQISSLFERVNKMIDKYAALNYSTDDIAKVLEDKTGIILISDKH